MQSNLIQAIIRKANTVAATFAGKPGEATRARMKACGAEFRNGQWLLTLPENIVGNEEDAVKAFEALAKLAKHQPA